MTVTKLLTKAEQERERLIREARAIYESIFPTQGTPHVKD